MFNVFLDIYYSYISEHINLENKIWKKKKLLVFKEKIIIPGNWGVIFFFFFWINMVTEGTSTTSFLKCTFFFSWHLECLYSNAPTYLYKFKFLYRILLSRVFQFLLPYQTTDRAFKRKESAGTGRHTHILMVFREGIFLLFTKRSTDLWRSLYSTSFLFLTFHPLTNSPFYNISPPFFLCSPTFWAIYPFFFSLSKIILKFHKPKIFFKIHIPNLNHHFLFFFVPVSQRKDNRNNFQRKLMEFLCSYWLKILISLTKIFKYTFLILKISWFLFKKKERKNS